MKTNWKILNYFAFFATRDVYTQDIPAITQQYHRLLKIFHPDNAAQLPDQAKFIATTFTAHANDAYQTLCCPLKRAVYLLKHKGIDIESETDTQMPIDFLNEQMELRERLSEHDSNVKAYVSAQLALCEQKLTEYFDAKTENLMLAREWVRKMQFYQKLSDEIRAAEYASITH